MKSFVLVLASGKATVSTDMAFLKELKKGEKGARIMTVAKFLAMQRESAPNN